MLCTSIIEGPPPLMPPDKDDDDYQQELPVSTPATGSDGSRRRSSSRSLMMAVAALVGVLFFFLAFCDDDWILMTLSRKNTKNSNSSNNGNKNKNGHSSTSTPVVRTILAIQDPDLRGYVDARNNPVYEDLRATTKIIMRNNGTTKKKGLSVELNNKDDISSPVTASTAASSSRSLMMASSSSSSSSLTVSWNNNDVIRDDDDILVLYCHGSNNENDDTTMISTTNVLVYSKIVEAATMSQVKSTAAAAARQHYGTARQHAAEKNKWHIPRIPMTLQRQDNCQFLLLQKKKHHNNNSKNATYYYEIVDESEILEWHRHGGRPNNKNTPMGIHLSLTNSSSSILVHFNTHGNMGTPVVQYGIINHPTKKKKSKIREMDKKEGYTSTYSNHDMCEAPANETGPGQFQDPGFLHTVVLDHLHSNTKYTYRVGFETGQGVTWSPYSNFTTAMEPGQQQKDEDYVFIVYGDQGIPVGRTWELGHHWMVQMEQWEQKAHAIHLVGDLSYARGVAHIWDDWFELLQPVSTSKFYMVGVGNHEYCHHKGGADGKDPSGVTTDAGFHPIWGNMENDSGGECGVPTAQRFTMPQSKNSNGVFWYSYAVGLVHTIVISSEHDLSEGSRLHTWLKQELESIDRKVTPWVIVECHRPLYEGDVDWGQVQVGVGMRYEFEDLLYDYQVDVYLAGHIHAYHRTCDGVYRSQCHQGGPIHFTIGTMGAELVRSEVTAPWTAHALLDTFGYGRFTVKNATAMHFEFVQLVDDVNDNATAGTVLDDVWIVRER